MKILARRCAGLCLLATLAATLISRTSTSAPQQTLSPAQARGKAVYQRSCIACHALQGAGDAFTSVPALAQQRFAYLREQLVHFSTDERHSSRMRWAFDHASKNPLQFANDLAAYLSHLPTQRFASGDSRFHAEGEKDFVTLCAACHGKDARGNSAGTIPSLRTQQDSYLVDRLRRLAAPSSTIRITAHETDDHTIVAIAAYLSTLPGMNDDSARPTSP